MRPSSGSFCMPRTCNFATRSQVSFWNLKLLSPLTCKKYWTSKISCSPLETQGSLCYNMSVIDVVLPLVPASRNPISGANACPRYFSSNPSLWDVLSIWRRSLARRIETGVVHDAHSAHVVDGAGITGSLLPGYFTCNYCNVHPGRKE